MEEVLLPAHPFTDDHLVAVDILSPHGQGQGVRVKTYRRFLGCGVHPGIVQEQPGGVCAARRSDRQRFTVLRAVVSLAL